jgi:hypothetical protein
VADAEELLDGKLTSVTDVTATYAVINFNEPNNVVGNLFPNTVGFPGIPLGGESNFAVEAKGVVNIPTAGAYTFGVSSDDGFSLSIGSFSMAFPGLRSPGQTYSTFLFPTAGKYPVDLVYFQHTINAELELFASPGSFTTYGQKGSNFQLVGNTADGGLALASPSVGAMPEPSGLAMMAPLMLALLVRPRRGNPRC